MAAESLQDSVGMNDSAPTRNLSSFGSCRSLPGNSEKVQRETVDWQDTDVILSFSHSVNILGHLLCAKHYSRHWDTVCFGRERHEIGNQ